MERLLDERFMLTPSGNRARRADRNKVHVVRYADDFVVTAATPEVAEEAKSLLVPFLAERGLGLSREKTLTTHTDEGFDFLSWNFRKYGGKLIIKPSKGAVKAFQRETHRVILAEGKCAGPDELIATLTPMIRGFAAYHRHTCCSETFSGIADVMFRQLWRWACRRHPNKSRTWVARRYWRQVGTSGWVFGSQDGYLAPITCQHVVRHLPLRTDVNPYLDSKYFVTRRHALKTRAAKSFRMPAPPQ